MELFKQKMAAYDAWVTAGARGVKHEKPTQPKEVDTLYDAGSTTGLGQLMNETEGRAVWLKHEARKLIKKLAEGGTIGSFDEINQIIEHAYYRSSPVNNNSKFCVDNPHLAALWLMHVEDTSVFYSYSVVYRPWRFLHSILPEL